MKPMHALLLACAAGISLAACQKEGAAEKAGKAIDQSAAKAGDKIESATEKVGEALERAGDKVKEKTDH